MPCDFARILTNSRCITTSSGRSGTTSRAHDADAHVTGSNLPTYLIGPPRTTAELPRCFCVPEFPLSDYLALSFGCVVGNASGRRRLADL